MLSATLQLTAHLLSSPQDKATGVGYSVDYVGRFVLSFHHSVSQIYLLTIRLLMALEQHAILPSPSPLLTRWTLTTHYQEEEINLHIGLNFPGLG